MTTIDPEDIGLAAHNLERALGNIVGEGGTLDTSSVALVRSLPLKSTPDHRVPEGESGLAYYTVIVGDQAGAA